MKPTQILVVDDSNTIRSSLVRLLQRELQAEVTGASDGVEGFEQAWENDFDLIISDIDMPRMNGFDLCRKLKAEKATCGVPVIIMSSNDQESDLELGFEIGAAAYVIKSDASRELVPRIKDILQKISILRDKKVLVVDDSKPLRNSVGAGLEQQGFKVVKASNGQEALEVMESLTPDLILSDIVMPVMNGIDLLKHVRRTPVLRETPFVVMSVASDRRIMRQMMQQGASAFLVKPFNIEQLIITAEKLLSDHFKILLHEKMQLESERQMLMNSIASLAIALEARDPYTRGHSESVATIACEIAVLMGLSEEDRGNIELAARLHDIGKIGIRDSVLLKPGKLTPEERAIIEEHPVKGAEILRPIPSMEPLIPAVLHHHERCDGSGYPHGLKGKDIHLWARIIAVADVFDALTSHRTYRTALDLEKALAIIKDCTGSHLCPDCVEAFFNTPHTIL